jgi:hypothetical protein
MIEPVDAQPFVDALDGTITGDFSKAKEWLENLEKNLNPI